MADIDLKIRIAGEAGQGLQTIGLLLSKAFARKGLFVFSSQEIQSRIRGGHNSFQIRVSNHSVLAPHPTTDILVAFDVGSRCHFRELQKGSLVIFDSTQVALDVSGVTAMDVPMAKIAQDNGGNRIMANTVAMGVILGLLAFDIRVLHDLIRETFGGKEEASVEANIRLAQAGYDHGKKNISTHRLASLSGIEGKGKMVVGGSESVALGALAAGCQFISAYPMSPSTGIMTYLAGQQEGFHLVVEQSEDEIASINMALGASFAGVRAMTASSGGGFALMVEGLSLAGMVEVPLVIVLAQRPAPATGLPTRTAQEDLLFAIHAGHGEFPRFVMAPATIEDAFYASARAFDLADKYRVPVIILTDQLLADSLVTVDAFKADDRAIRRYLMSEEELKSTREFKSYQLTKSGVSPRALPGNPYCFVTADSDEHDETGRITEDLDTVRPAMVRKRMAKASALIKEVRPPRLWGPKTAKNFLIGWGSTFGALREAVDRLNSEGKNVRLVHFEDVWPLNPKHFSFLNKAKSVCVAENNATAQFSRLVTMTTGHKIKHSIAKYDGLPLSAPDVVRAYKKCR